MAVIDGGNDTAGKANVDSNFNLNVNLPTNGTQTGTVRNGFLRDASTFREGRITEDGDFFSAAGRTTFSCDFNGAAAGALINTQFNQQATTMATALNGGFLRFNNAAVTTANIGVSVNSWRNFTLEDGLTTKVRAHIRHAQGSVANKVFEFGLGYYDVAANQAAATNEFIGYRWTSSGALIGVLEYSTGGAPTSLTVNINGGVPFADNASRFYEIIITENTVEFWIDGVYQASIQDQPDAPGMTKSSGLPLLARLYQTSAPAAAPVFDIGSISVLRYGPEADIPLSYRQALMGRHSNQGQSGLTTTTGNTALIQASGTAPTGTTGSNTATTITGLGGYYALNGAAVTATAHSNIIISSFQNPVIPEAAGVASDARNLVITDILISPMVVTTVLAGGGAVWEWFIAVGSTALSLATTDAIGGAAIGTSSPRITPLPIFDTIAAAAAVGTVATRNGNSSVSFGTPLVVFPGQFVHVGIRSIWVNAAITSGVMMGGIGVSGFWD